MLKHLLTGKLSKVKLYMSQIMNHLNNNSNNKKDNKLL
jgi:hypothetical protein